MQFYIPFSKNRPQLIEIKGHRLLLVSEIENQIKTVLPDLGADEVRRVDGDAKMLELLASESGGGVLIAPENISFKTALRYLERDLPWVH
ncbi:hypothetical protein JNK13_02175 [bacterium]|nr:hypothetical protein [bacterium]